MMKAAKCAPDLWAIDIMVPDAAFAKLAGLQHVRLTDVQTVTRVPLVAAPVHIEVPATPHAVHTVDQLTATDQKLDKSE